MIANSGDRNLLRTHIYRWASERDRGRESPPPAYSPANTPLGQETDAQSLTRLPGAVQRQRVIPIRTKPANVTMFMPKRMSLVSTIRLGRTWWGLDSHGDITAFAGSHYPPVAPLAAYR